MGIKLAEGLEVFCCRRLASQAVEISRFTRTFSRNEQRDDELSILSARSISKR